MWSVDHDTWGSWVYEHAVASLSARRSPLSVAADCAAPMTYLCLCYAMWSGTRGDAEVVEGGGEEGGLKAV